MTFVASGTFRGPPAFVPPHYDPIAYDDEAGVVVIQSDDGNIGDYTVSFPLLSRRSQAVSQFAPFRRFPMCAAVNTADINGTGKMTEANLVAMHRQGHEIISHGRHHRSLGVSELIVEAAEGAGTLVVQNPGRFGVASEGYAYSITGGGNTQTILVGSKASETQGDGTIILTGGALAHTFPAGSEIVMTGASVAALVGGCIEDLAEWGIAARHHVYAWNASTESARAIVATLVDSARADGGVNLPSEGVDLYQLKSDGSTSEAAVTAALDEAAAGNGVLIYYGHGSTSATAVARLNHLLDEAASRGMRVVTISEAVTRMSAW